MSPANVEATMISVFVLGFCAGIGIYRYMVIRALRHTIENLLGDVARYAIIAGEPETEVQSKIAGYRKELNQHGL